MNFFIFGIRVQAIAPIQGEESPDTARKDTGEIPGMQLMHDGKCHRKQTADGSLRAQARVKR